MKNLYILTGAIDYIEENLCEDIKSQDIAMHCYVSLSSLQKLFRYALHHSVKEYIERRRLTMSAKDICSGLAITEVALKYQYNSLEVFSRAFKRFWNTSPSTFRTYHGFTGLYPKLKFQY